MTGTALLDVEMRPVAATVTAVQRQTIDDPKLVALLERLRNYDPVTAKSHSTLIDCDDETLTSTQKVDIEGLVGELDRWPQWRFQKLADLYEWIGPLNAMKAALSQLMCDNPAILLLSSTVDCTAAGDGIKTPNQAESHLEANSVPPSVLRATATILRFLSNLLKNATNKQVFNSVQELNDLLAANDDAIASLALEALSSLAMLPISHRHQTPECKNESHINGSPIGELNWDLISVVSSFLTLKEKTIVGSINRIWRKASTLDKYVKINPYTAGANLNGALEFVTRKFIQLQDFHFCVDQGYFCNDDNQLLDCDCDNELSNEDANLCTLKLNGNALKEFFEKKSGLRSIKICFADCKKNYKSKVLIEEGGLSTLNKQNCLQNLSLSYVTFESVQSLSQTLGHLSNLVSLSLNQAHFPLSDSTQIDRPWRSGAVLMSYIGRLRKLRCLSINNHKLVDDDLIKMTPICAELRCLELKGRSGDPRSANSLTDKFLEFIGTNCPKLQYLNVNYNRRMTFNGLLNVMNGCSFLRAIEIGANALNSYHLEQVVKTRPSLRLIAFWPSSFSSSSVNEHLKRASTACDGRVLFIGYNGCYAPSFNQDLMQGYRETKREISKLEATQSNGWNMWEDLAS